nr:immunoglobulin heavy chain junction region [Macaca mulatta]
CAILARTTLYNSLDVW